MSGTTVTGYKIFAVSVFFLKRKSNTEYEQLYAESILSTEDKTGRIYFKMSVNGYYREPHTEVAEFLGVTYQHLLYVLAEFVKEGILQKTKYGYFVADEEKLSHDFLMEH